MSNGALYRYVFTLNEQDDIKLDERCRILLIRTLRRECKRWCFQLERGEAGGLLHYQGRISLKSKLRKSELLGRIHPEWNIYWSGERDEERSQFYVEKSETSVAGPWSDKDVERYIPRQLRGIELQGWQAELYTRIKTFDTRSIHFVVDETGGIGKSTFVSYMACRGEACLIPQSCSSADDMMQYACKIVGDRKENIVFLLDVPRSVEDKSWGKWLSALESMKNGFLYDHRYTATEKWIDSPGIVVFANELPPPTMLTGDRIKIIKPGRFDAGAAIRYGEERDGEIIDLSHED